MRVKLVGRVEQIDREGWQPAEFFCPFFSDSDKGDLDIRIDSGAPDFHANNRSVSVMWWCHVI